jgi:ABC-2 type transport system ATP-binding protein
MEYAVETFSLTKIFSDWWGRGKVYAVDDLNLQIQYNEVFGLLGPNGSGKTTTLKMLLGLLYPTKGKALCLGGDATDPKISARIGFLPEESYLYKYLTARETLDFYGRLFRLDRRVRRMRIDALLDMVGLKAVANRPVGTFSKGMARRIGLAQALINDPDLLILDEPTTGLDPIGTRQIKNLILKLAKRGKTVLLCSHLLADVEDVCDRIAILYGGKIQAKGQVAELLQQTHKRQFTTGVISDSAVERIKRIVQEENAECVVTSPMHKLETFFIETVVAAQRQDRRTSGAVSTTKIGDFLAAETVSENILDKLVSAPVSPQTPIEPPPTEDAISTESAEPKPDERVLSKLTEPAVPTSPVADHKIHTQPVETDAAAKDHVRSDILDELAGRSKPKTKDPSRTDENQAGGSGDA